MAVAVLLAASAIATPARGQHCGSYVTRPGDHVLKAALGLSAAADRMEADSPTPADPTRGRPCNGPSCSKAPAAPAPSPAPPAPPSVEHWAIVARDTGADLPGTSPLPSSEAPHRPAHLAGGVFHPPRPR